MYHGGMTIQRTLRMTSPTGDVYAANLNMDWHVTKELPEHLKSTNYESLQLIQFSSLSFFRCFGMLLYRPQGQASQATHVASWPLL